jgi:hypothetical protein
MTTTVWLVAGLGLLALATYRAGRVWIDAGSMAGSLRLRIHWTLQGTFFPARYWWGTRIEARSAQERAELLAVETANLGLSRADAERCPLCTAEIPRAWTVRTGAQPGPSSAVITAQITTGERL